MSLNLYDDNILININNENNLINVSQKKRKDKKKVDDELFWILDKSL